MEMQEMFRTNTTSQVIHKLRKTKTDKEIAVMSQSCDKGIYLAIESILGKEVCANYCAESREILEDNSDV